MAGFWDQVVRFFRGGEEPTPEPSQSATPAKKAPAPSFTKPPAGQTPVTLNPRKDAWPTPQRANSDSSSQSTGAVTRKTTFEVPPVNDYRTWQGQPERNVRVSPMTSYYKPPAEETETDRLAKSREEYRTGLRTGLSEKSIFQTRKLSWDEYHALTPRQRAAVDLNTAFVQARESDRALGAKAVREKGYDEAVTSLFGEGGGSNTYAPSTVALLQSLDLGDTTQGDLDNYLDRSALVTESDLKYLADDFDTTPYLRSADSERPQRNVRVWNSIRLGDRATESLSHVLARGQNLLDAARGGAVLTVAERLGTATPQADAMNQLFDTLARRDAFSEIQDSEFWEQIDYLQQTFPELDPQKIFDHFGRRLNQFEMSKGSKDSNGSIGRDPGIDYITPEEFRGRYFGTGG